MKRIFESQNFPTDVPNPVVALGNFDGVHIGHLRIIETLHTEARQRNGTSVIYTFDPHPARILSPEHCPPLLQTIEQRLSALEECGLDVCVVEQFTKEFAHQDANEFFRKVIADRLRAKAIIIGYDFTFGLHRQGSAEDMQKLGNEYGIGVMIVEAQFEGETLISSTNIRHHITHGEIGPANQLLGRNYLIEGNVVLGRGLGKKLGASTANIEVENELIPADGVYLTRTRVGTGTALLPSVTSIGSSPTFPESPHTIETHILDTNMDIMGQKIAVEFIKRTRDQIAFDSVEKLRDQIARDIEKARAYHKEYNSKNKHQRAKTQ